MYSAEFLPEELSAAETLALRAAREVAPTLLENFGKAEHTTKSNERDWVTKWDTWAEEQIAEQLTKFSGDVGILGEESGVNGNQDVYWTIDAIDGTSGFVRGMDTCTTMVALIDAQRPVVSVIYDFVRNISYSAVERGGAFRNETQPLSISQRHMSTAYIETYLPDDEIGRDITAKIRATGAYILQRVSAGQMFTDIARGATEGFVSYSNPFSTIWDYAPGALLVREAGGVVMNIGSDTYRVDNPDFIASNPSTFGTLRNAVQDAVS